MARTPYTQLDYSGTAIIQTLTNSGGINATATTFNISDSSTWKNQYGYYLGSGPTNTAGSQPFVVAIDYNTAQEEKVLCSSVSSGGLVTVLQRGFDGTTASSHTSTTINCVPVFSAVEADEANTAVASTIGLIGAQGDLLVGTGTNSLAKLGVQGSQGYNLATTGTTVAWRPGFPYTVGTSGQFLTSDGTKPVWSTYAGPTKYIGRSTLTSINVTYAVLSSTSTTFNTVSSAASPVWTLDSTVSTGVTSASNGTYNGIVIPTTGTYRVGATLAMTAGSASTGLVTLQIVKMSSSPTVLGGTTKTYESFGSGQNGDISFQDIVACTANDVIGIQITVTGSNLTISTGSIISVELL